MASLIGRMAALTSLFDGDWDVQSVAAGASAGPAATLDLQGAVRGLMFIRYDVAFGEEDPLGDPYIPRLTYLDGAVTGSADGVITFETSYDGGITWATAACVRRIEDADTVDAMSTLGPDKIPGAFKIDHLDGPAMFRARITTAFASPLVAQAVAVGK